MFSIDFSEITPLFHETHSIILKRILLGIFILLGACYLLIFFVYRKALIAYIRTTGFLCQSIFFLAILSIGSVFVVPHDFFWYFIRMGMILTVLVIAYFHFHQYLAR